MEDALMGHAVSRQFLFLILLFLPAALLSSCAPVTTIPIGTIDFNQSGAKRQPTLLVFLPGIRDKAAVFAEKGFVSAVRKSGIEADMIGVEANFEYYQKDEILPRLKQDVIDPAKQQGYRNIWLVGISLGGFGAIWYDIEHPGDVTGIVELAPYLGDPEVIGEVATAGGLPGWQPPENIENDKQRKIWRGLKTYESRNRTMNRLYLGYGMQDKFAPACGILAALLPPAQVFTAKGGHDWSSWQPMWDAILKSMLHL
jgi:enterochelin esterase-like enzyme